MAERRSHMRFRAQGTAILKDAASAPVEVKASVQDLSFTGMSVISHQAMVHGVYVAIELTDLTALRGTFALGTGKVVRVARIQRDGTEVFKIGVRFTAVEQCLLQRLILAIRKPSRNVKNPVRTAASLCKRSASWL